MLRLVFRMRDAVVNRFLIALGFRMDDMPLLDKLVLAGSRRCNTWERDTVVFDKRCR